MFYVFENPNNYASWVKGDEHLTASQITEAVVLETLPVEEEIDGFIGLLKCSKAENRVWYEYVEKIPSSEELKLLTLKEQVDFLNIAMAEILGGAV